MTQDEVLKEFQEQKIKDRDAAILQWRDRVEKLFALTTNLGINRDDIVLDYSHPVGLTANYPGILGKLAPNLMKDKDGLYAICDIERFFKRNSNASGNYLAESFGVLFSHYFRRGYGKANNWTPYFVNLFSHHLRDMAKKCYVLLDEDRVRVDADESRYVEMDTWYGPKFNKNIDEIQDGNVMLKAPMDLADGYVDFIFGGICSLNIMWATGDKVKTFQAMEFKQIGKTINVNGKIYHPSKYIHSEYDLCNGGFIHLDGAIQLLTQDEYLQRSASDFSNYNKNSRQIKPIYKKLFKVNGPIKLNDWMDLISHFFHADPLIHEYFEGKYPDRITELLDHIRENGL